MSLENVEILRWAYDAYNRGDLKAFAAMLDPDATWQPDPNWPEVQARHGPEEVLRLLADIREPLDRNEAAAEELIDAGDRIVVHHCWRGVISGTEDEVEGRLGMIVTFRAGKVTDVRFFETFGEALEAAGLRE
jgi:ketosteroid isomerase-like protein